MANPNFINDLHNLNLNNLSEVKQFLKSEKLTQEDLVQILGTMAVTDDQISEVNALIESFKNGEKAGAVVEKSKAGILMMSAGATLLAILILISINFSGTHPTQEVAPDKIEEVKPDVKGVDVVENTYTVKAEDMVKTVEGGNEATVEKVKKTEEVTSEDEIDLDAMDIDANDLVVVKTALENADQAKKDADQAKKDADQAKKDADQAKKDADAIRAKVDISKKDADQAKKDADQAKKDAEEVKFAFGKKGNK